MPRIFTLLSTAFFIGVMKPENSRYWESEPKDPTPGIIIFVDFEISDASEIILQLIPRS
jgi:hypothetical protein